MTSSFLFFLIFFFLISFLFFFFFFFFLLLFCSPCWPCLESDEATFQQRAWPAVLGQRLRSSHQLFTLATFGGAENAQLVVALALTQQPLHRDFFFPNSQVYARFNLRGDVFILFLSRCRRWRKLNQRATCLCIPTPMRPGAWCTFACRWSICASWSSS